MKKLLIISFLVLQTSASFYDAFAPVENSFGKLVTDVVSDLKDTIDCAIYAVERVLSLDGLFGHQPSNYEERCKGQKEEQSVENGQLSSDSEEITTEKPQVKTIKQIMSQEIQNSVSNATTQIKTILEQSQTHQKITNVKDSLRNETDRLTKISLMLSQQISKIPENVKKKFEFKQDRPSLENVLDEVKFLYKVEQKDKGSAEANEVRQVFYQVLNVLHANETNDKLSDEDEVKKIIENLGKLSNISVVDVENQVSQWTNEQKQLLIVTKNDTPPTQSEIAHFDVKIKLDTKSLKSNPKKYDEMEKGQIELAGFSRSVKNLTKSDLKKVNSTSQNDKIQLLTEHRNCSTDRFLSHEIAEAGVSTTNTPQTTEQITTISKQPKIPPIPVLVGISPSTNQSSETIENAKSAFVDSSSESKMTSSGSVILDKIRVSEESIFQTKNQTYATSSISVNGTFPQADEQTTFSKDSVASHRKNLIDISTIAPVLQKINTSANSLSQVRNLATASTKQPGQAPVIKVTSLPPENPVDIHTSSIPSYNPVNGVISNTTIEQAPVSKTPSSLYMSTSPLLLLTKQKFASSIKSSEPVNDVSHITPSPQTIEPKSKVADSSQPNNNVVITNASGPVLLKQPSISIKFSSQAVNIASISTTQNFQTNQQTTVPQYTAFQTNNGVYNISNASIPLSMKQIMVPSDKSSHQTVTDTNIPATQSALAIKQTSIGSVLSNQKNDVGISTTQLPHSVKKAPVSDEHDLPGNRKQLLQTQNQLPLLPAILPSTLNEETYISMRQPPRSTTRHHTAQQENPVMEQEKFNLASRVIEQEQSNIANRLIEEEKSKRPNRLMEQENTDIVNRVIIQEKSDITRIANRIIQQEKADTPDRIIEQKRADIVNRVVAHEKSDKENPVIGQEKSDTLNHVMEVEKTDTVNRVIAQEKTLLSSLTKGPKMRITTQSNPPDAQNVPSPTTAPPVLKTFQDVAKSIFTESSMTARQRDEELTQSFFEEFGDEEDPFAYGDATAEGIEKSNLFNDFFEPQDQQSHKAAVESAKSIIAQSKRSNAVMNNLLKNSDPAAEPSAFDNPDDFFDFDTK